MAPGEFDLRVDAFAAKVKTASVPAQISAYLTYAGLAKFH
jgi:hypothetical protein